MKYEFQLTDKYLREKIDAYVEHALKDYVHYKVIEDKIIHDSVHGTNLFRPFEIAIFNLPIIQRLRRLSQTDVSSFVFPAGNHTRFEHTVGVTVVAGQMVNAICNKNDKIDRDKILRNCRVAAIFHDCGHGPFSHLSEQVYGFQFKDIIKKEAKFKGASPHEIIAYYIVKSKRIKEFNEEVLKKEYLVDIDLDSVSNMIIGYIDRNDKSEVGYAIEVINGAFDADKLDYILRDAHSTGLEMAVDLPRLMYTVDTMFDDKGVERLTIDIKGVAALEGIVFNKMMLTSTIYHHHKVRAAGQVLRDVFKCSTLFNDATDFLNYTDDNIFCLPSETCVTVENNIKMIKNRVLPKRAFCFAARTLSKGHEKTFAKISSQLDDEIIVNALIKFICDYVEKEKGKKINLDQIWIDSPSMPKFKEASQCLIKSGGPKNTQIHLRDVFPTDDWVKAFSENKWRGYVFTLPEYCDYVNEASKNVFEEFFKTKFNDDSREFCKIDIGLTEECK